MKSSNSVKTSKVVQQSGEGITDIIESLTREYYTFCSGPVDLCNTFLHCWNRNVYNSVLLNGVIWLAMVAVIGLPQNHDPVGHFYIFLS
jgi:hypothetical protein